MYLIALNVAISYVRSRSQHDHHTVAFDSALHDVADERGADVETDGQIRALQRVIAQLDVLNRALLLLYLDEHSYRELGDILGLSEPNVATKINRPKQIGRAACRERVGQNVEISVVAVTLKKKKTQ